MEDGKLGGGGELVFRLIAFENLPDFEQRHIGKAAVGILLRSRDKPRNEARPHVGKIGRDRIGERELGLAATEQFGLRLRYKRPGHRLVDPARSGGPPQEAGDHPASNLVDDQCDHGSRDADTFATIKNGVAVYNLVTLEDEVFVGPNAVFTNDMIPRAGRHKGSADQFLPTRVRLGASIGANATIVCGTEIGSYALVGAGAVVTRNVPPHAIVKGNPARIAGWACECGRPLIMSEARQWHCEHCDRAYSGGEFGE